jgi:hypothetical protein
MKAVICNEIENSFLDLFQKNIQHKYPSASIEYCPANDILTVEPADECIIMVVNEKVIEDSFTFIKDAFRNLEHLLCVVEPENYKEYQRLYGSVCKVFPKNKLEIQRWFDSLVGEPIKIQHKKGEVLKTSEVEEFDILDDLNMDLELEIEDLSVEGPDLKDLGIEAEELEKEELDLPLDDNFSFDEKTVSVSEEDSLPEIELEVQEDSLEDRSFEEHGLDDVELPDEIPNEISMNDIEIDEEELVQNSIEKDSLVGEEKPLDSRIANTPEEIMKTENIISSETNVMENEEMKKMMEKQIRHQRYEEKIIALRDILEIPVWKKRRIDSKTIGVWSPLHRIGVTTLTMNMAFFFAQLSIPVAVLEGITKNLKMKSLLSKYDKGNANQHSYNSYLSDERVNPKDAVWKYRNVHFFPFEQQDIRSKWDSERVYYFINGLKFHDLLLVDFPTGEMAPYTLDSLQHIDELWIVINDDLLGLAEWREYIHTVLQPKVPLYLLFNGEFPFSKPKKISEAIGLPLLATIPDLYQEIAQNQYESIPLLEHQGVFEKIEKSFLLILQHLIGEEIDIRSKETSESNFLNQLVKRLKLW